MDPKALIADWLDGSAGSHYGYSYREWIKRGGFVVRVEVHPATDAWMMGDRYGEVVNVGRKYLHVRMDRSGRTLRFSRHYIYKIV